MEEVLNLHFDEIELVVVVMSLHVGKYCDKNLGNMSPPLVKFQKKKLKHAFMYVKLLIMF